MSKEGRFLFVPYILKKEVKTVIGMIIVIAGAILIGIYAMVRPTYIQVKKGKAKKVNLIFPVLAFTFIIGAMTLLAFWGLSLSPYNGSQDILPGVSQSERISALSPHNKTTLFAYDEKTNKTDNSKNDIFVYSDANGSTQTITDWKPGGSPLVEIVKDAKPGEDYLSTTTCQQRPKDYWNWINPFSAAPRKDSGWEEGSTVTKRVFHVTDESFIDTRNAA